jgi:hypothetical protein
MNKNTYNAIDNLIALGIVKDKPAIIKVLQRNGVKVNSSDNDQKITAAVLAGLRSQAFRKDLTDVLSKNALAHRSIVARDVKTRADGDPVDPHDQYLNDLYTGNTSTKPGGTGSANSGTTKSGGGNFSNFLSQTILKPDTINQFISTGLNALNTNMANKRESAAQKTLELQNAQAYYQSQAGVNNAGTGAGTPTAKSNKGLIIGLSILGVALIGVTIYFAVRKKK